MPRDASGNYTLPLGNPVANGTIIDVNWANPTMSDIAVQLNNVITRDGVVGFTTPLKIVDGSLALPGLQFISEANTGIYRPGNKTVGIVGGGVETGRFDLNGLTTPGLQVNGTAAISGNATIGGSLTVTANIEAASYNNHAGVTIEVPIGAVIDYAGTVVVPGYFPCNGMAISRVTYAILFSKIGTTWGAGDGSTTFNVPNLERRVTMGAGGSAQAPPTPTVGQLGGAELQTLAIGHLPAHNHGINDPGHNHTHNEGAHGHQAIDSGHLHGMSAWRTARLSINNIVANFFGSGGEGGIAPVANTDIGVANVGIVPAVTGVSNNPAATGINQTVNTGSGIAFSLNQPSAVMMKMIRAL